MSFSDLEYAGISAGSAEVKARQITMHGKLGHVHLVIHGAYGMICLPLLEQMLEQPF
ncbi:hypothetical protein METHP14_70002 [Pseudomonas sp. P14-2025]